MEFEDVEDAQTFYKAYARRKGFAIRTNHTRLSKDDKTLCAVDYVCTRAGFRQLMKRLNHNMVIENMARGYAWACPEHHNYHDDKAMANALQRHILCVFGKKAKLDRLPQCYILDRWTMNAKSRPIPNIPCSEGQVRQGENEAIMRKFKSMIQLYDIVELASQSTEKHNHFTLALEKVHKELLTMEDHVECSQRGEGTNDDQILRSQVVSNFSQTVQDPSRVSMKGRPKSLRTKNPKESQPTKKRRCTICKNEGH
ncbi:hypothetical protein LWI29_002124 [Acer saccharum]|uniref:FAR1 domain-containing protein n=1 Tax=Acer saccharum TaxID=4024 RepID=A0AA39THM7_ACESA|nr:hypothetical protein LWI29_002124 [Acer saccharum]